MTSEEIKNVMTKLENGLYKIVNNENSIYFLIYDTKNNPRASVKYIYDFALALQKKGYNTKILVEETNYTGVEPWLGDRYKSLPVVSIKGGKADINVDDFLFIPEYYSYILDQILSIKCSKTMIIQQKEYVFDTLSVGSKWSDYGIERCVTTSNETKKYLNEFFPETITNVLPPFIDDVFKETNAPQKPFIGIHCRERIKAKKIISEFYIKNPHLRWVTFRDLVNLPYDEFAEKLSECLASVWVDDDSTFGTFPLESMKCNVPIIGKVPDTKPDWLGENGIWVTDDKDIPTVLSSYVTSWIDNSKISDEFKESMKNTLSEYTKEKFEENAITIFETIVKSRIEIYNKAINNLKTKEEEK